MQVSPPQKLAVRWGFRAEPSIKQRPKWLLAAMSPEGHDYEKELSQAKTSCAQTTRADKSQGVAAAQSDT